MTAFEAFEAGLWLSSDFLAGMQIEDIEAEQKLLMLQAAQDPTALERYRVLELRRKVLLGVVPHAA